MNYKQFKIILIMDKLLQTIVISILNFDKNVLKKYFNIETPLYKIYWQRYSKYMQNRINKDKILNNKPIYKHI